MSPWREAGELLREHETKRMAKLGLESLFGLPTARTPTEQEQDEARRERQQEMKRRERNRSRR
jgi:hypothetical protein